MRCPVEQIVQDALVRKNIAHLTGENGDNPSGLDFLLTDHGVEIEVKQFHAPRISEQMSRASDVIAVQGRRAAKFLADLVDANPVSSPVRAYRWSSDALKRYGSGTVISIGRSPEEAREAARNAFPDWMRQHREWLFNSDGGFNDEEDEREWGEILATFESDIAGEPEALETCFIQGSE